MEIKKTLLFSDVLTSAEDVAQKVTETEQTVVVLPALVARLSQLLEQRPVAVWTLIDYPFGNGMTAKKAFEIGNAFENNAAGVFVCLTPRLFATENFAALAEQLEICQAVSVGRGEFSFLINLSYLKESQKLDFSDWLKTQSYRAFTFTFAPGYDLENDLAIFRFALGSEVRLSVLNATNTPLDEAMLEKYDVAELFHEAIVASD